MSAAIPTPYAPDTRAKGWRFELDLEQVSQSDTWALASPEMRPWLLMLWSVAWQQVPCGSLPNDDTIIAARIGMKSPSFLKNRSVLMRGWQVAEDGRLYHPTITQRVLAMLTVKQKEKDRKAAYREKMSQSNKEMSHGTDAGQTRDRHGIDPGCDATGTGTGTGTGLKEKEKEKEGPPSASLQVVGAQPEKPAEAPGVLPIDEKAKKPPPAAKAVPPCPHDRILALWAEVLPKLPQHRLWTETRRKHLQTRWRDTAIENGWTSQEQGMDWFRRLFVFVGESRFLTGRAPSSRPGQPPFVCELEWLLLPSNWAKVIEGKYHQEAA